MKALNNCGNLSLQILRILFKRCFMRRFSCPLSTPLFGFFQPRFASVKTYKKSKVMSHWESELEGLITRTKRFLKNEKIKIDDPHYLAASELLARLEALRSNPSKAEKMSLFIDKRLYNTNYNAWTKKDIFVGNFENLRFIFLEAYRLVNSLPASPCVPEGRK